MSSLSHESECDDSVKCGSARGKATLLRSLLRKDRFLHTCETCIPGF